jgi:Domain of unknown function (DUF4926)
MEMSEMELFSVVAVLRDLPEHRLVRGQVGTIVEELAPDVNLVEFSDDEGHTYALVALRSDELIRLHHRPLEQVA